MMEIQVSRLRNALLLLEPIVPRKVGKKGASSMPILTNVLLQDGRAYATDLEVGATIDLPEVKGQALLPFKAVWELLRLVPGNSVLTIEAQKRSLSLSWPGGQSAYTVLSAADYPAIPQFAPLLTQRIQGNILVSALSSVVGFCAADNDKRPVLNGVSLFLGEKPMVAGADGFWLGYKKLPIAMPESNGMKTMVIPSRSVEILEHLWKRGPRPQPQNGGNLVELVASKGNLEIEANKTYMKARFGEVALYTRLIDGTPPDFMQLVPVDLTNTLQIYAADLEMAVQRVKKTAKDGSDIVRMTWADGKMTVSAKAAEESSVETDIPVQTQNGPGKIAVDIAHLLKYIKGREGLITMQTKDHNKPLVLRHGTSPTVVLMPMFVQWPGEPPANLPAPTAEAKVETEAEASEKTEPPEEPEEGGEEPGTTEPAEAAE